MLEVTTNRHNLKGVSNLIRFSITSQKAIMAAVDQVTKKVFNQNFNSEGQASGKSWKPLTKETKRAKERKGLGNLILQATGAMKNALTTPASDHFTRIRKIGNNIIQYFSGARGNEGQKTRRHAEGAGHLPVRDATLVSTRGRDLVVREVKAAVIKQIRVNKMRLR